MEACENHDASRLQVCASTQTLHAGQSGMVRYSRAEGQVYNAKIKGIFQLYVLKLLKMQARYLGRIWRKSNMDIISAIYLRVRHRLNDDWVRGGEHGRLAHKSKITIALRHLLTRLAPNLGTSKWRKES